MKVLLCLMTFLTILYAETNEIKRYKALCEDLGNIRQKVNLNAIDGEKTKKQLENLEKFVQVLCRKNTESEQSIKRITQSLNDNKQEQKALWAKLRGLGHIKRTRIERLEIEITKIAQQMTDADIARKLQKTLQHVQQLQKDLEKQNNALEWVIQHRLQLEISEKKLSEVWNRFHSLKAIDDIAQKSGTLRTEEELYWGRKLAENLASPERDLRARTLTYLKAITGKNYGYDVDSWLKALSISDKGELPGKLIIYPLHVIGNMPNEVGKILSEILIGAMKPAEFIFLEQQYFAEIYKHRFFQTNDEKELKDLAHRLNARYILLGSVHFHKGTYSASMRIVDCRTLQIIQKYSVQHASNFIQLKEKLIHCIENVPMDYLE